MHQILMSRKMTLEPCTLTLYIAYAYFIVLGKMEETHMKNALRFRICVDEGLVKKLANVHSDNLMFSKLNDLFAGPIWLGISCFCVMPVL
ncbi:unnamed protein product [Brassica rapa]|uniref:Uncharacterized protein n=1 Tax=Brassica campestris TaxID=3711 RepID=A0A3P6ASG1_BRACM|nr:unnamed protein product [Brassica rapa]VDC87038.1 unnamed protein product [Brassica rapa]